MHIARDPQKKYFQGDDAKVVELLGQGANPNHADQLGSTPLHWAAQGGHERIIPILINAGGSLKGNHCSALADAPPADLSSLAKNVKKLTPQEVAAGKAKANKAIWKEPKRR